MKTNLQVFFYAVLSSILLSCAIPNEIFSFGQPILAFLSLICFYHAVKHTQNYREAFFCGFTQTFITHILSSFWLAYFKDFALFTLGASAIGTGLIGGMFGFLFHIPYAENHSKNILNKYALYKPFYKNSFFRPLYFAVVWTSYEWFKSSGFLGYPWGTVSSAMYRFSILTQIADLTGTYGISFFTAYTSSVLAEFFFCNERLFSDFKNFAKPKKNFTSEYFFSAELSLVFVAVLSALIFVYGSYQRNKERTIKKTLTAILVQQNSDPWKMASDYDSILVSQRLTTEKLRELSEQGKECNLIVWSEGCLRRAFPYAINHYREFPSESPLIPFIADCGTPMICGGIYARNSEKMQYMNVAHMFDSYGRYRGYYAKNHLVPFAEVIPFTEIPAVEKILKKVVGISAGYLPGDKYVCFEVPCSDASDGNSGAYKLIDVSEPFGNSDDKKTTVKFAVPICFDDAFTDIMRPLFKGGAELFVNISDDSWSLKKSSEIQHFVIASYRAIEYRTTLVRSTNAGYSAIVTPDGRITADEPLFEESALAAEIPVYEHKETLYSLLGNYFPYACLFFIAAYCLIFRMNFLQSDYIPSERKIRKSKKSRKNKKKLKNKK